MFSKRQGQNIIYSAVGGDLVSLDASRACRLGATEETIQWRNSCTASSIIHTMKQLPETSPYGPLLCVGLDDGGIQLWDERLCGDHGSLKRACVLSWKENEDYISGFDYDADGSTLLASSADCTMSVMDLRKASSPQTKSDSFRKSDDQEDELLSIQVLKSGRKVVCGTQQGVLAVWSWGTWGDVSDRFPGHPASIDCMLKVDEDTILTGSSDGLMRLVQIHPDKLLGALGDHEGFPVERLYFNCDRSWIGSVSHDNFVRLWDGRVLQEDYVQEEAEKEHAGAGADQKVAPPASKHDSDDDWEDDKISDASESDCDGDTEEDETANDRRSKRLKSDNDDFFADL
jgi:WD40 repeat protein